MVVSGIKKSKRRGRPIKHERGRGDLRDTGIKPRKTRTQSIKEVEPLEAYQPAHGMNRDHELSPRHRVFIQEWLKDFNGARAAVAAGCSKSAASATACQWLNGAYYPLVAKAAQEALEQKRIDCELDSKRIIMELSRLAFLNPKNLFNADGSLIDLDNLSDSVAACIKKFKVSRRIVKGSEEDEPEEIQITEIEFWDKLSALEMLAKHFGLFKDVTVQNNNYLSIDWGAMKITSDPPPMMIEARPIVPKVSDTPTDTYPPENQ